MNARQSEGIFDGRNLHGLLNCSYGQNLNEKAFCSELAGWIDVSEINWCRDLSTGGRAELLVEKRGDRD